MRPHRSLSLTLLPPQPQHASSTNAPINHGRKTTCRSLSQQSDQRKILRTSSHLNKQNASITSPTPPSITTCKKQQQPSPPARAHHSQLILRATSSPQHGVEPHSLYWTVHPNKNYLHG